MIHVPTGARQKCGRVGSCYVGRWGAGALELRDRRLAIIILAYCSPEDGVA